MKAARNVALDNELSWLLSAIEGAKLLSQMAEGEPSEATRIATNVHAILRLVSARLHDLTTTDDVDSSRRQR